MMIEKVDIGLISIGLTLLLMALRLPIGIALIGVSIGGIATVLNFRAAWSIANSIPYSFVASWELSAVPMFLLMGYLAARAELTTGLFVSMRILLNRIPGSLASASVAASALFAAASGSSVATSAALARIAVPEMLKAKYDKALATGCIAAAGTLGSLIPPSILMVIYGLFTDTSIGALFLAGVIPGVLTAFAFALMITIRVRLRPDIAPKSDVIFTREEKLAAFRDIWPLPMIIVGVLGGLFAGAFTPTEAGAVGAMLVCLISAVRRTLTFRMLLEAAKDAAVSTTVMFVIAMGAAMYIRLMGLTGVPDFLADQMLTLTDNTFLILLLISLIFIFLGMFIDSIGIMLLTLPVVMPLLQELGIDMIWFGIITIKLLEIGLITPPVGLNVYVVKSALGDKVKLTTVFRGAAWFLFADLLVLLLLILFPIISLWLPGQMAQ
ncbi:tripartite ATP-independent transporter DctM subunit [Paracoccus versutus]|uniref:TRAP transporter large permease protein n=1 Tax=Paracoccus versutus TaxID=34007 RepID=A0A3D9XSH1_PARVE|nr:TRAP transporter large permease subunit [Paracoccus versutus]REF73345.1 tripartite ATP-independent transporter DctM subunit [Paracoccus versutus]